MLTRRFVQDRLRDRLMIWANPNRIGSYVDGNDHPQHRRVEMLRRYRLRILATRLEELEPFALPNSGFPRVVRFEELPRYQKVMDFVGSLDDYRKSTWYRNLQQDILQSGVARHKSIYMRSMDDLDAFFQGFVLDLIGSIQRDGYIVSRSSEHGLVMIGADGELLKANRGRHRFFVARWVGLPTMPFIVWGVHEAWLRRHRVNATAAGIERLAEALDAVAQSHR
jgi:hypothetical protein